MKPILFNTTMVQAILEGRKTETRRVIKPQPFGQLYKTESDGLFAECELVFNEYRSPYQPGDILYVRETFQVDYLSNIIGSGRIKYKDGTFMDIQFAPERYDMMRRAHRKPGWRPSENMPREAARIFLRVKDVRVEHLQDITEDGKTAEGMHAGWQHYNFYELWDSTIKPAERAYYGWEANPWVWVIEFERISKEEASEQEE